MPSYWSVTASMLGVLLSMGVFYGMELNAVFYESMGRKAREDAPKKRESSSQKVTMDWVIKMECREYMVEWEYE